MSVNLPTSPCRNCHEPIAWVRNDKTGNTMPIDPTPNAHGNIVVAYVNGKLVAHVVLKSEQATISGTRFVAHFVTCPVLNNQRREKAATKPQKPKPDHEQGSLL